MRCRPQLLRLGKYWNATSTLVLGRSYEKYELLNVNIDSRLSVDSASTASSWLMESPTPAVTYARFVLTSRGPTDAAICERRRRPRLSLLSSATAPATNHRCPRYRT